MDINLDFCDNYKYPPLIKSLLLKVILQIGESVGWEQIYSIILYGSTSRGELTYSVNGELDLYSDFEFEVVTRKKTSKTVIERLKNRLARGKLGINNRLFHVDITFNTKAALYLKRLLDRRIANYEMKENGKILYGENIIKSMPSININNLDIGNTNELILVRLWMQLLFMPTAIYGGHMSKAEEGLVKYCLARNSLELITIFLPNEGVLLPTYKSRVEYYVKNYSNNRYFPHDYADYLYACYLTKRDLNYTYSLEEYYYHLLIGYISMIECLIKQKPQNDDIDRRVEAINNYLSKNTIKCLNDSPLSKYKRIRNELFYVFRCRKNPLRSLLWLIKDKRPQIIGSLLNMHMYLYKNMVKAGHSDIYLSKASEYLKRCDLMGINHEKAAGVGKWVLLREEIISFMGNWLYNNPSYPKSILKE
jgi:hypothetical protein